MLQVELLKVQRWVKESGEKVVILFEGRDAAGKGGTIKRFMEHMNPRGCRVVALEKPSETEKGQWYFQRYIKHLPTEGEIVLFDRSWYNRAGVERVMDFCQPNEYLEFMRQTPDLERMLVRSGIRLFKFWFSVTAEEQKVRFSKREIDPLKQWKLSPIDKLATEKWDDYTEEYKSLLKTKGLASLTFTLWMFGGLLTFNWLAFLIKIAFSFIIIAPISKLTQYSWAYTGLHWFNSLLGFAFGLFVIVNSYHLKIDLYAWFLGLF